MQPVTDTTTQCQAILERLQQSAGKWVSMLELVRVSGSYNVHSRIDELRHKRGLQIENRTERAPSSRKKISEYRIAA